MSHELEVVDGQAKMFYVGQTPWHGLGKPVDEENRFDIEHCLEASGLDTEVACCNMKACIPAIDGSINQVDVPERYTYRVSDNQFYGCVGPRYVPLQNRQAFQFFQPWLDTQQVSLNTAGSLFEGKKVWVLAKVESGTQDIRSGDPVEAFVLLSNSHDGTTSVRVDLTPIRVVCNNTLSMAHAAESAKFIRIRHTGQVEQNLNKVREIIDLVKNDFIATAEQYRFLASRDIHTADLQKYVRVMFDVAADETPSTRMVNLMDKVFARFEKEAPVAGYTWWNAYNAYNGYLCHEYGRVSNSSERLNSLWFGQNGASDRNALKLALTLASY